MSTSCGQSVPQEIEGTRDNINGTILALSLGNREPVIMKAQTRQALVAVRSHRVRMEPDSL